MFSTYTVNYVNTTVSRLFLACKLKSTCHSKFERFSCQFSVFFFNLSIKTMRVIAPKWIVYVLGLLHFIARWVCTHALLYSLTSFASIFKTGRDGEWGNIHLTDKISISSPRYLSQLSSEMPFTRGINLWRENMISRIKTQF